ncbi:hypothetical protein M422DRAFT_263305 [Sphaerobolus stellatus SS14]|uniref:O-methyltransferase domain-containing protein n=1 Tax=Sphaerobolus stellatus (strain SS14) TaxID=990650 RepID=A0A0C9UI58_SPHS4|nr:hypothetical protein M422DRAFT_263305 [Sphaerobolus stellatus SS14]
MGLVETRLDTLLAHITSAVSTIKSEYAQKGFLVPLLNSTDIHPMDLEDPSLAMADSMKTVDTACQELLATVINPYRHMVDKCLTLRSIPMTYCLPIFHPDNPVVHLLMKVIGHRALCAAIDAKIPSYLQENVENGLDVKTLSAKTGIEHRKLSRLMRYLTTKHFFCEGNDVFANNRYSMLLDVENLPNHIAWGISWCNEEGLAAISKFSETLHDPASSLSYSPWTCAMARAFDIPEGEDLYWMFAKSPGRELVLKRFGKGIMGLSESVGGSYTSAYPWDSLGPDAIMVDVGGGIGQACIKLYCRFPNLRFIIQDLPGIVDKARGHWGSNYPEAIDSGRVSFKALDFFKESPLEATHIYYHRLITHNWGDDECVQIFTNVRKAMRKHSKLLIHDFVLDEGFMQTHEGSSIINPLALNKFGFADDILMMVILNT